MNRWTARALALLLGVCLAAMLVFVLAIVSEPRVLTVIFPMWTAQLRSRSTVLPLGPSPTVDCLELSETLHVVTDSRDLFEPIREKEIGSDRMSVRAEFSGHWAETRIVRFRWNERTVTADAFYDTDVGFGIGNASVDSERSSVHLHPSAICFDLALQVLDGSWRAERWMGQVQLE